MVKALHFPVRSYLEARQQEIEQFRTEVAHGRVVVINGPHALHPARPDQLVNVMREFLSSISESPSAPAGSPEPRRSAPGQRVRVVRFNVKPDLRFEFERFFRESLKPAAAKCKEFRWKN